MPAIDRPLSGVTDVLGLTRYHHLANQMKETIELYEMTSRDAALTESSETLKKVINAQSLRLSDLDTNAGRFSTYFLIFVKALSAAYMLAIVFVFVRSPWTSSIVVTGAALSSLISAILLISAVETLFTQQKTERKRALT